MQQSRIPDVSRVQEVFEQVLSQPEFVKPADAPLLRALRWVLDTVGDLFERWFPDVGESQVRFMSWVLLVGSVAIVAYFSWRWISDRLPESMRKVRSQAEQAPPRDSAGWVAYARDEALAGRLRSAATGLYEAVILHLEAQGAVRYGEWKTPGDYAIEASTDPALRGPFRSFLGEFVAVAFGPVEPTPEALDALFTRAERLGCPI